MSDSAAIAAGWFLDPEDATHYRWWDGSAWTEHRSPVPEPAPAPAAAPALTVVPTPVAAQAPAAVETPVARGNGALSAHDLQVMAAAQQLLNTDPDSGRRTYTSTSSPGVPKAALLAVAAVVVIGGLAWLFLFRGSPEPASTATPPATNTPASTTSTTAATTATTPADTDCTGCAVPEAIDNATGNGVSKARDLAAKMEQQQAVADQAANSASGDPMADPSAAE